MMNGIVRSALRVSTMRSFTPLGRRDFTRTFWHMSKLSVTSTITLQKPSLICSCGCGIQHLHTKGERELIEFLSEEIAAEKKSRKGEVIPTEIDGFKVALNGAEVELTKQTDKEKINIFFNVNHNTDDEAILEETEEKSQMGEMKSKPNFEVDIVRGGKTLSFTCSFLKGPPAEGEYYDVFGIDEITLFEGEWTDKDYAVSGDVLDGYLYDLLVNLLEEKGISNEFADKLCNLSTNYEHSIYVGLLESLSKFSGGENKK